VKAENLKFKKPKFEDPKFKDPKFKDKEVEFSPSETRMAKTVSEFGLTVAVMVQRMGGYARFLW